MSCTYTYLHSSAQRNSTYHAQTCPTTTHSCDQAMYCTHVSVWSVELWVSAAAMCCAPSAPMELYPRLYAHVCARRTMQRTCVAHDARSHTHNRERGHIHTCIRVCRHTKYEHAFMPCTYTNHHSSAQRNSTYHAQTRPTTTHSCAQVMYCTYVSVSSVVLWASAAAMCCAPTAPMEFLPSLHAHVCVRITIQRTYVAHDARSHTYNRERGHIHPCIRVCRHTKYEHALMPCTYTNHHSNTQRNSTYHAQTHPTTMHSCEQAMYCAYASVWSVELWASASAMCCAPSAPMEFSQRLYAHVCVRTIQRTCVAHDARSHTYNRERGHIHQCIRACRHTKYEHAFMPCTYTAIIPVHNAIVHTMHERAPLLRTHANKDLLECLECGVVGKCCSNVLRSLRAYGVLAKPVCTYVCEKNNTAHVRS
jgi:hypothetical protein